ncbi:uncharacterized protein LOC121368177 [Gigantopelta aegis]|uniref:uncharacterized protein LOC121368177 n=1 Tax=Gigantopelta aegis TaxID=1735272 RepID=UPI001B88D137|nr:uncharacterized protein LOC121368177 [Gigantopelta aegis]
MNLTEGEVVFCLENLLKLTGAKDQIPKRGLPFLNAIILGFHMTFPFQNSILMAEDPTKRHRPTMAEIKEDMLSKRGGMCYTQNVFLYYLLQAIGYNVYFCPATVSTSVTNPYNHIVCLVKNVVTTDDVYLADTACGYPTFTAVSMQFDKESPVFKESFMEYKFIRHEGKILYMLGKGWFKPKIPLPFDLYIDGFRRFYSFELQFISDLRQFDDVFQNVYTLPELSPFHSNLRLISFPNKLALIFVSNKMKTENGDHEFDCVTFDDNEDLLKSYLKHFPQLGEQTVRSAIKNWQLALK